MTKTKEEIKDELKLLKIKSIVIKVVAALVIGLLEAAAFVEVFYLFKK